MCSLGYPLLVLVFHFGLFHWRNHLKPSLLRWNIGVAHWSVYFFQSFWMSWSGEDFVPFSCSCSIEISIFRFLDLISLSVFPLTNSYHFVHMVIEYSQTPAKWLQIVNSYSPWAYKLLDNINTLTQTVYWKHVSLGYVSFVWGYPSIDWMLTQNVCTVHDIIEHPRSWRKGALCFCHKAFFNIAKRCNNFVIYTLKYEKVPILSCALFWESIF